MVEDTASTARALLGLAAGAVKLSSAECGGRDVFVQSTSGNRQLKPGSKMLFEVEFVQQASSQRPNTTTSNKRKHTAEGAAGSKRPAPSTPSSSSSAPPPPSPSPTTPAPASTPTTAARPDDDHGDDDDNGDHGDGSGDGDADEDDEKGEVNDDDPDRAGRPPLVVAWMDRAAAALPKAFPALQHDRLLVAFITQAGVQQVTEMFEAHAAGECQCIEAATVEDLAAHEWFGSDFYYEDNWSFPNGCLKGYVGYEKFPERFPDMGGWDEAAGTYSCEDLFTLLRQCVCDTIKAACCCDNADADADAGAGAGAGAAADAAARPLPLGMARQPTAITADPPPEQAVGRTRVVLAEPVSNIAFCSTTRRLFCLCYSGSTHQRHLVVLDAGSGDEVGRLSADTIRAGCHGGGGPICIGGRMLMFGDDERYFQVYDCATLRELHASRNPKTGKYAHEDAVRGAKMINGELFTASYHYARRWDVRDVVGTPAGPPVLLTNYSGAGSSGGSVHDFQVASDGGCPLFVACDEKNIRAYALGKSRCIKKGISGWVSQLLPVEEGGGGGGGTFVCTGGSAWREESAWNVSAADVRKLMVLKPPAKGYGGWTLCRDPNSGQLFGVAETKLLELELDLARGGPSAWKVVRVVGQLDPTARGARPFVSAEGRLYTFSSAGLREWGAPPPSA